MGLLDSVVSVAAPVVGGLLGGPAGAAAGAAIGGGLLGNEAARQGRMSQEAASRAAIAEQQRQFDLMRQDTAPYRQAGQDALQRMNALLSGDMSQFRADPGYQFSVEQMNRAMDRRHSATGDLLSGRGILEAQRRAGGLADQQYGNYWNRLAGLAGVGQAGVGQATVAGQAAAGNIGNAMLGAGQARANAYMTGAQALNQGLQGATGNWLLNQYLQRPPVGTPGWNPSGPGSHPGWM